MEGNTNPSRDTSVAESGRVALDEQFFTASLAAFEARASMLADRLLPAVRVALEEQPLGEALIAKIRRQEWSALLHSTRVERRGFIPRVYATAHRRLNVDYAGRRADGVALYESHQTAQLLLANWHEALARSPLRQTLLEALARDDANPLPKGSFVGLEIQVLPIEAAFPVFLRYLRDTEPSGSDTVLPPRTP